MCVCVCVCVCVCACLHWCVCVYPPDVINIKWTLYDWLNKFYSFYVAAVVGIISRHGLSIDVHHGNQPNKHKPALYKPSTSFNSHLKLLYIDKQQKKALQL